MFAAPASADDVDTLVDEMESLSRQAATTNEQVLELEEELTAAQGEIDKATVDVDESARELTTAQDRVDALERDGAEARALADQARDAKSNVQRVIDQIAASNYRGTLIDPLMNAVNADDPQSMIDRMAYMGVLSREADDALNQAEADNRTAADRASRANAAVAEANWARAELADKHDDLAEAHQRLTDEKAALEARKAELDSEKQLLDVQMADVQARVDSLSGVELDRWLTKDNPIDPATLGINAEGAVASALSKIGSPYQWGAAGPSAFDCSGLMVWSYQQQGKSIPRTSQAQIAGGTSVSKSDLQPGDIVGFYPGVTHVGMYIGNGQVVHASDYGIPVQVVPLDSMPFAGASRY